MLSLQPVLSKGRPSQSIAKIGWYKGVLAVEFNSGSLYAYTGVSRAIYDEFLGAKSKGQFFHNEIRAAGFDFQSCDSMEELLDLLGLDPAIQAEVDAAIAAARLFRWQSLPQGDTFF